MRDVDGSSDKPTVADPKQHLNRQNELSALFPDLKKKKKNKEGERQ